MSELQIGLLSIGIIVVVGVYGYGFWQQRLYRRKFGSTFKDQREDALYSSVSSAKGAADVLIEEEVSALEHGESQQAKADDEICSLLDATTDYVVAIKLKSPLSSHALASLWGRRFDFGKSVNACGLNATSGRWERLIPESLPSYSEFKIGLQLADRTGQVSEVRLTDFHEVLREIGAHLQAEIVLPSMEDAIKQAKQLDEFCAGVDQMIGLNILPGGDRLLFGSEIARVAERHGLTLQADGAFHLLDAHGLTLFSLNNMDSNIPFQHHMLTQMRVQGLTLLLDVPRVERPSHHFDEMAVLARELAMDLRAGLVDDHRVSLGDAAIAQIREQVVALENRMLAGKLVPGSAQAIRLFS
ncbi:MAG: cell division protein ZipA C-terminal FtsZ-binding domain-containing protein [Gallionellaceae bacterium]|jgi:FtsZ-interacting cell division protein ZipA